MADENAPADTQPDRCRLYLITPAAFEAEEFAVRLSAALAGGDVASVQLRLKDAAGAPAKDSEIVRAAEILMPIARDAGAAFLINDRADIAKVVGADGVHLGQDDGSVTEARNMLGPDAAIGVTCHASRHLAFEAGDAGADYVAFGAFHPTSTKETEHAAEPELLTWWDELAEIPSVAIGGITVENAGALAKAGAHFVAVCSAVWDHSEGPEAAVAEFNKVLEAAAG